MLLENMDFKSAIANIIKNIRENNTMKGDMKTKNNAPNQ